MVGILTYKHLQGRIFKRDGVSYLVVDDNDWVGDMVTIKSIDAHRAISRMSLKEVLIAISPAIQA